MNRLELVRNEVDALLSKQKRLQERRDGYIHLYGVAQLCSILAIKRKLDIELCSIIGLLHDIYTYKHGYVQEHATLGATEAEELLKSLDAFTDEEIKIIATAISNHSDKKTKHDKYSELIKDADSLHTMLYNSSIEVKHKKRLTKVFRNLGIKMKLKKQKHAEPELESQPVEEI